MSVHKQMRLYHEITLAWHSQAVRGDEGRISGDRTGGPGMLTHRHW